MDAQHFSDSLPPAESPTADPELPDPTEPTEPELPGEGGEGVAGCGLERDCCCWILGASEIHTLYTHYILVLSRTCLHMRVRESKTMELSWSWFNVMVVCIKSVYLYVFICFFEITFLLHIPIYDIYI